MSKSGLTVYHLSCVKFMHGAHDHYLEISNNSFFYHRIKIIISTLHNIHKEYPFKINKHVRFSENNFFFKRKVFYVKMIKSCNFKEC